MFISLKSHPVAIVLFSFFLLNATQTGSAQSRRTFDEGFDPQMGVTFEESAPTALDKAISPDGRLRVETGYMKIRVYEGDEVLHTFSTSGSTNAPLFSPDGTKLIAAVCRGNLGCISTLYSWDLKTGGSTILGECSGTVLDISTDESGKRLAMTTYYGQIFSQVLADRQGKWYGGELVIFDMAKPGDSVRVFCELSGVPSLKELAGEAKDPDELAASIRKQLDDANRNNLPVRVGVTPDGDKVICVTSTGVTRVFDARTGKAIMALSSRNRVGPKLFSSGAR